MNTFKTLVYFIIALCILLHVSAELHENKVGSGVKESNKNGTHVSATRPLDDVELDVYKILAEKYEKEATQDHDSEDHASIAFSFVKAAEYYELVGNTSKASNLYGKAAKEYGKAATQTQADGTIYYSITSSYYTSKSQKLAKSMPPPKPEL